MEKNIIYYVYKTTCLVNGKVYVGKHRCFKQHDKRYLGSGKLLKRAIKKYGIDNFIQEILEYTNSEEENREREIFWIKELNSQIPNGYNISPGGLGGFTQYDEESHKWVALNSWENISKEEHDKRVKKTTEAINKPEVIKKISEASKFWHESLSLEEKEKWKQKCSDGWTEAGKIEAGKRLAKRNKSLKGISIKETFIKRYGELEGLKHYKEYVEKQHKAYFINKESRDAKAKKTLEIKKKFPKYKEYCKQTAKVQSLRTLHKRGKISDDEFNSSYENEVNILNSLKSELRRFVNDFNNGKTF